MWLIVLRQVLFRQGTLLLLILEAAHQLGPVEGAGCSALSPVGLASSLIASFRLRRLTDA